MRDLDLRAPLATVALFGDTDFASNRYIEELDNRDLFLNTVNWMTGDESLISIRPREEVFRPLVLTASEYDFIRYLSWFLLPAALAAIAVFTWWRRR